MPIKVKCPACKTQIPGEFDHGAPVSCELCGEEFAAPARAVAKPAAPKADAQPAPQPVPQPVPDKGPGVDFDFSRKAARKRRPERDRDEADDRDDRPRPRRTREEPRGRPRREEQPSGGTPVGLIVGSVLAGLLLLVLTAGGGLWYISRQARLERAAEENALANSQRVEEERFWADRQRQMLDDQNRQQQNANPVVPPNAPGLPVNPGMIPGQPQPFQPPPFQPPVQPPVPAEPPQPAGPPLPQFNEPKNPYSPGAQIKLRELRSVDLPKLPAPPKNNQPWNQPVNDYTKFVYAPKHELLFALSPKSVWVYDVSTGKEVGTQAAKQTFSDTSLSPDGAVLFVADYGGERTGYGDPINPSRVHRFDCETRKWEDRKAPKIAWKIEAVDAGRVLLLEQDQWVDVTLNKWETDGVGIRELARVNSDYNGDIEYDPRTGRIYHGNRGISSQQLSVRALDGDKLKAIGGTGTYGSASGGGPTVVLSQDGSRLYYGTLQVGTTDVNKNLQKMQGMIFAASRDIAFSDKAYYRATTGSKLGEFEFKTMAADPRGFGGLPPVITVSPDGLSVWVLDRDKNAARQFALEGEK